MSRSPSCYREGTPRCVTVAGIEPVHAAASLRCEVGALQLGAGPRCEVGALQLGAGPRCEVGACRFASSSGVHDGIVRMVLCA